MYSDSDRAQLPHSKYVTVHEPFLMWNQFQIFPIEYWGGHTPPSPARQCSFIYLNLFYIEILGVLIPLQNMFKMFPKISGLENITFVKGRYWDIAVTIESIIFNLYRWLYVVPQ